MKVRIAFCLHVIVLLSCFSYRPTTTTCHQKRTVHSLIIHPDNRPILQCVQASLLATNLFAVPHDLLSLRLCIGPELCTHMNLQTQTICIHVIIVALIGKLRTRVSIIRSTEADRLQFLADLPPIRPHTELGPLVPTPILLLSQAWSLM